MIPQLKSIFNKNQWVQIQNWVNGRLSLKTDKFDANNTASGASSVTLNTTSGVAVFTSSIPVSDFLSFELNNTNISSTSILSLDLAYNDEGTPIIAYYSCSSNKVFITIANINPTDVTNGNLSVSFQILN